MKKQVLNLLAVITVAATVFVMGCGKETSFEIPNNPATGTLQSDVTGDCLPKTVNGIYMAASALIPATNTITVQVNVTTTGTYVVTTDTVNGYFFRGVGTFTALGPVTVTLRGNGTPFAAGINNFVVSFSGTVCDIAVTVVPAGTGVAVYTANCAGAVVNGTYTSGTALTPTNTITIPVTVTTAGTYTLTGTINGMTFSNSGLLAVGATTITLNGIGTPSVPGTVNLVVGSCTIPITVAPAAGAAVFTMNCAGATVNGPALQVGTNLTAANTITIPVSTITTPGTYSFTNLTVNGMTFNGSGNLTTLPATITLNPVTTTSPTAPGTFNLSVGSCSIPVTSTAGSGNAVYTVNCAGVTVNGPAFQVGVNPTAANTITIPVTAVTTPGAYSFNVVVDGMVFTASGNLTTAPATITLNPNINIPPNAPAGAYILAAAGCNIPITVTPAAGGPATFTLTCGSAVVNGAHVVSTGLVAVTNYVDITVNVTVAGTYTAITATGGGMTFTKAAGSFATTGNQTIRLDGSGTAPAATGNTTVTFAAPFASCSFPVKVLANDYFPRTNGSNWSYEFDDNANDSLYRNATANTISAAANTWTIFMQNDGSGSDSSGYYRRNSGDYYEWFDFGDFVGLDASVWTEYIMLKDNVALNTSWTTGAVCGTATGTPICVGFNYKIEQKDQAITFDGKTYQNVIVVLEKLDYSLNGGVTWLDATSTIDYYARSYYARGIGLIKAEAFHSNNAPYSGGRQENRRWVVN